MSTIPSISELLPHAGPMRLLHRVLEHGPEGAACEARTEDAAIFRDASGRVPAWVAIEWMAQCSGIHGAALVIARGEKPGLGFLTGGRAIRLLVPYLPEAETLRVEARPAGQAAGLYSFACRTLTQAGELLA